MLSILQRLRQRKIVQWAIAYAATAWVSLEVFDLIAEQFFWPVWVRQSASVLLLFGLFITIVLAWYHGERGRQKIGMVELVLLIVLLSLGGQSVWLLRDRGLNIEPDVDKPNWRFGLSHSRRIRLRSCPASTWVEMRTGHTLRTAWQRS